MFIEKPASKLSLSKRRLVFGIGVNDANYIVMNKTKEKQEMCPYYSRWVDMLRRCHSENYLVRFPTYIGCTICEPWLTFSKFKSWMVDQDWQDKHLDKDLLVQGNKVYSPKSCLFVSSQVNTLLTDSKANRGLYPVGVYFDKRRNKFQAKLRISGKQIYLGSFINEKQAANCYLKAKYKLIQEVALNQPEPLRTSLLNYKIN